MCLTLGGEEGRLIEVFTLDRQRIDSLQPNMYCSRTKTRIRTVLRDPRFKKTSSLQDL